MNMRERITTKSKKNYTPITISFPSYIIIILILFIIFLSAPLVIIPAAPFYVISHT